MMSTSLIIPNELFSFVVDQNYSDYSDEDRKVWQIVISEKEELLLNHSDFIDSTYLLGFSKIGFSSKQIPTLDDINKVLRTVGWSAVCVDGYLPATVYAGFIEHKIFPVAKHIRSLEHISYSPTPDFIHDVTGHLPMLFSQNYQKFLQRIIELMSKAPGNYLDEALFNANGELGNLKQSQNTMDLKIQKIQQEIGVIQSKLKANPSALTHLSRMFLWSIEFGLIGTLENYKCFGAGMLSSTTEIMAACKKYRNILPYSLNVIDYEINLSDIQNQYFVTEDYDKLSDVLNQYLNKNAPAIFNKQVANK